MGDFLRHELALQREDKKAAWSLLDEMNATLSSSGGIQNFLEEGASGDDYAIYLGAMFQGLCRSRIEGTHLSLEDRRREINQLLLLDFELGDMLDRRQRTNNTKKALQAMFAEVDGTIQ